MEFFKIHKQDGEAYVAFVSDVLGMLHSHGSNGKYLPYEPMHNKMGNILYVPVIIVKLLSINL